MYCPGRCHAGRYILEQIIARTSYNGLIRMKNRTCVHLKKLRQRCHASAPDRPTVAVAEKNLRAGSNASMA